MDLFQRVMCAELLASPGIHEAAAERGSGEMMITDPRNPWVEQNMVLPEDFLGAFVITDGKISADTYVRNPGYRLIGHHGRFRLPPAQEAAIRAEVIRAVGQTPE
jgi:hypothetical protein